MKSVIFCLIFIFHAITVFCADYSIVFIHIGSQLPAYLQTAIAQARLFNQQSDIYLVANEEALKALPSIYADAAVQIVPCETLAKTDVHHQFNRSSTLDKTFRNGFWNHATERFFYLHDLVQQYGLTSVFHMENDIMLYADLKEHLPIFQQQYRGMLGATFDNDNRCIPGFMYIDGVLPLQGLVQFIAREAHGGSNDMESIAQFKERHHKKYIDYLPILPLSYAQEHPLRSMMGSEAREKAHYYNCIDLFHSIFDAAAIGQYLGGIDPRNGVSKPGFVNESCVFNPEHFSFEWKCDEQGREIPYIVYNGESWRINNLHIHSKKLHEFYSIKSLRGND